MVVIIKSSPETIKQIRYLLNYGVNNTAPFELRQNDYGQKKRRCFNKARGIHFSKFSPSVSCTCCVPDRRFAGMIYLPEQYCSDYKKQGNIFSVLHKISADMVRMHFLDQARLERVESLHEPCVLLGGKLFHFLGIPWPMKSEARNQPLIEKQKPSPSYPYIRIILPTGVP